MSENLKTLDEIREFHKVFWEFNILNFEEEKERERERV